jgi:hypothetical protein
MTLPIQFSLTISGIALRVKHERQGSAKAAAAIRGDGVLTIPKGILGGDMEESFNAQRDRDETPDDGVCRQ